MTKSRKNLKWYEDGRVITYLIVLICFIAIITTQAIAVSSGGELISFGSVINHSSRYLFILIYFGLLCFSIGKKYFNYLNMYLVFIYFISSVTSFLTLIQSFGLSGLISFMVNVALFLYLSHTMFRNTRIWKEYDFSDSPFNEISNDNFFFFIVFLLVFELVVNLISTAVMSGLLISILDTLYLLLISRYVYLYRDYLDFNEIDSNNKGNFDEIKKNISETVSKVDEKVDVVREKLNDMIENVDLSKTIDNLSEKISDVSGEFANKTSDLIENGKKNIEKIIDESEDADNLEKEKNSKKDDLDKKTKSSKSVAGEDEKTSKVSKEKDKDEKTSKDLKVEDKDAKFKPKTRKRVDVEDKRDKDTIVNDKSKSNNGTRAKAKTGTDTKTRSSKRDGDDK